MVRTQIYLTEKEKAGLGSLAKSTGKKQAELIRMAVDRLIESASQSQRETVLDLATGLWKDRDDLPDFNAARNSWDRS